MELPEVVDYFGIPLEVGDRVLFPASGEMMEGNITKLFVREAGVKNDSGYTKRKLFKVLINLSVIKEKLPEYSL